MKTAAKVLLAAAMASAAPAWMHAAPAEVAQAAATATVPTPADPKVGQPEADVVSLLGEPLGRAGDARRAVLLYPRGSVTVANGVATEVRLMSRADFATRQAAESAAAAKQAEAAAQLESLRQKLLNDPAFLALSANDRLLALDRFDREHPGSLVWQDIQELLKVIRDEQTEQLRAAALARAKAAPPAAAPAPASSATAAAAAQPAPPAPAAQPQAPNFSYSSGNYLMAGTVVPYWPNVGAPTIAINGNAVAISPGNFGYAPWCGPAGSTIIFIGGPNGITQPIQVGRTRIYPGPPQQ